MDGGAEKQFGYNYLLGTNLLQTLTMPNGITLEQSYEAQRDLLISTVNKHGEANLASREYIYDALRRPTARDTKQQDTEKNDTFAYNNRSELVNAVISGTTHAYDYDNIGNRRMSIEGEEYSLYESNALNQYTAVQEGSGSTEPSAFTPTFDADGNQTLVKTGTGVWCVEYNAENRPVAFTRTEGDVPTRVTCTYDSMGRRVTKKVESNGETTLHQRYLYRGYLQVAACDLTSEGTPCLWHILWDPTQSVATRPLAIQKDGTWYTYGWDLTKNICEVFGPAGDIRTAYTYSPYGEVTETGDVEQPIQWSSEYIDTELGIVYYNYRYYNPADGRWLGRDILGEKEHSSLYMYCKNNVIMRTDYIGLKTSYEDRPCMQTLSADYLGKEYASGKVYEKCGGNVYANHKSAPNLFKDSCALRVSRALNHSTHKIIKISGIEKDRFISDADKNLNLLSANELMYYIERQFGKPDLMVYGGEWADKVKDRCAIVFYVNEYKNATHAGLLKDGEPYSDGHGNTRRRAHIWFVPCVCVLDDKCEYCKQKIEEEKRKQKQMERFIKDLIELQSRV